METREELESRAYSPRVGCSQLDRANLLEAERKAERQATNRNRTAWGWPGQAVRMTGAEGKAAALASSA